MKTVRVAAAQTVEFREDVNAALKCLVSVTASAEAAGASLLCFSEGFLQGYLTDEDSARRNAIELNSSVFTAMLSQFPKTGPMLVVGMIEMDGGKLFNSALVIRHGVLLGRYRKSHLLEGERIFDAGNENVIFEVDGLQFGINICYDTNFPEAARKVAALGASLIVCPANNMMNRKTAEIWRDRHNAVRSERCRETNCWLISADVTGAREGRVSWGPTAIINPQGEVIVQLPLDTEGLLVFDIPCSP